MDPLSDVLSLLKPQSYNFRGLEAAGAWSIQFPELEGIKCYALVCGELWLSVEGVADPLHMVSGDCVLLPLPRPFRMASDLTLPGLDALAVFSAPANGGVATVNGGGDVSGVGGVFTLEGRVADILLRVLPPIVHVRREYDRAALRWVVDRMRAELRERRPGGALALQHLAQMMLLEALRAHVAEGARGGAGWLLALADRQIGAAISAMHEDLAHQWTLQTLAEHSAMSRSAFAQKFKETVGSSPMDYLTRWRMLMAADRLANSNDSIARIAPAFGYDSESAFSTAFKRVMGCSPRQYARDGTSTPAAVDLGLDQDLSPPEPLAD
jgi:AraC-like DNA-binding protein